MSRKLSFGIAINLATEKFRSGVASVKSLLGSLQPGMVGIITGIAAFGFAAFKKMYDEHKRIKNIFNEYKKEVANLGSIKEVKVLESQLAIMNSKTRSQKEINAAQAALQKMLGKEKLSQEEINKRIAKRIELLKASAKADYYARKAVEKEDVIRSRALDLGIKPEDLTNLAQLKSDNKLDEYFAELDKVSGITSKLEMKQGRLQKSVTLKQVNFRKSIIDVMSETVKDLEVLADADKSLIESQSLANTLAPTKVDNVAIRASEKRLEALRKLDEEDRKRQIDKQKVDIEIQQKAIDILDDSFEKRTKQTILNLEKEKLAIEQHQSDLLKQQSEHLKNKYVSVHGTDKGFGEYFKKAQANNFKDGNGVSILPEGLRPEDIASQVNQLLDAAQAAQRKGLANINKDLSTMLREQELMFASSLDKRLAEIDTYYNEELKKAEGNAALIARLEANKAQETFTAKQHDKVDKLDFEEQLKLERVAGMESIGMTELVEEKKLEITKKYLQLKIDALQSLADLGDEDAKKQVQMYQASLKKLNMQKPANSLKALADKAIFDTIKKGFQNAGDSADSAEEKTTNLMGSISQKAGMIANITSELQSMFGGMDEGLDEALSAVGNIASGFAQGGIVGGAMAVIGEGMKLFSKASEAAARHQKALKDIEEARLASQRAYNLLLREQNLLLEEAVSIFGEKQITRAANAIANYRDSIKDIKDEMQGSFRPDEARESQLEKLASSGGIMGAYFGKQLQDYRKQVDNYNKGINQLANQQIVTGHKKTGLFGWGKGKDTYSGILDVYPEIIKANGEIDKGVLQVVLDTRKMSDETRKYLENIIALQDAAEAAQEELRNYLQATFGVLGDDIMTSIENAIKDKGISAWEEFGEAGAKVIEQLGKQIAYELFFADKFKKLQEQLEGVYGSGKDEEAIAREAMDLVGKFYQGIGKDMELAQGFMENWQKEAQKYGLELWKPDQSSTQDTTKGYSVSMDQDTGGAILGRITGIHESILTLTSMVSGITMDTSKSLAYTIGIGDELKKQTEIFHEMRDIQTKTLTISKEMKESLGVLGDIKSDLDSINKNTKGLAPR